MFVIAFVQSYNLLINLSYGQAKHICLPITYIDR